MTRYYSSLVAATLLGLLLSIATVTLAQVPPANEEALGKRLITEMQTGLVCSASLITTQRRIADLEKELADLKKPAEPEKKK